jgi:amidophosphoribosyltransferase
MGLVSQAFHETDLKRLEGHIAIGHTRYSTTGSTNIQNAQPIMARNGSTELALAHNGNIINAQELRAELSEMGYSFTSTTDSEVLAYLLASAPSEEWSQKVSYMMRRAVGAYSLTVLTKDALVGIRDPHGVRPLCLGKLDSGWIIASESCALDHLGAQYLREIDPGETVIIDKRGLTSVPFLGELPPPSPCVFEHIYFARPDSLLGGKLTYLSRVAMGKQLAREHPVESDIVIGIPDSANAAAVGFAQESGIPYTEGLVRNRYVGRTFIEPDQQFRELGVRMKYNPLPEVIYGKRVVIVDDSIVRGTTTPQVVKIVRKVGAKEIHMRICAPPIRHPCHFGVDLPTRRELIAANMTVDEIRQFIGADSLGYLSINGLMNSVGGNGSSFCAACFTGMYPIPVQLEMDKLALEHL